MNEIIDRVNNLSKEWNDFASEHKNDSRISKLENSMANIEASLVRPNIDFGAVAEKSDLDDYVRTGQVNMEVKSLSSGSNEDGGFTVTPSLYKKILGGITAKSPMRRLASVDTISTGALDVLLETEKFTCGWALEGANRPETDTAKLTQKRIVVHELYAQPKATQKLLDDSEINIENWLTERLEDSFMRAENHSFIMGDGNNKPKGILAYDDIKRVAVSVEGKISIEDILQLINSLDENYLPGAHFLMHRSTLSEIQKLQDNNGRFLWQPAISESLPETLFGIPLVCSSDMPRFEAGNLAIALADFKAGYKIVDRAGISITRDPYTEKPFVKFYSVKRVGGDVVNANAIKLLRV